MSSSLRSIAGRYCDLSSRWMFAGHSTHAHSSFTEFQIERGNHDHIEERRGDDSAEDDDGHRLLDFFSGLIDAQRQRNEADRSNQRRHQNWTEALERAAHDGFTKRNIL